MHNLTHLVLTIKKINQFFIIELKKKKYGKFS